MSGAVVITGASGFIGRATAPAFRSRGWDVVGASRTEAPSMPGIRFVTISDRGAETAWDEAVAGADVVVHLAGRAHVMRESLASSQLQNHLVNTVGTRRVAEAAARAGVRRIVYVSTAKVSGDRSQPGQPLQESSPLTPHGPYAESKVAAERALREVSEAAQMEYVVVRPPLVYGPGARGNFQALVKLVRAGIPLPLGGVDNRRSMIAVDNLADFLLLVASHPNAVNRTFNVSDADDVSTPRLIRTIAELLGRRARLVPVRPAALRRIARLTGRSGAITRLVDSMQLDVSQATRELDWVPAVPFTEGIHRAVQPAGARLLSVLP